MNRENLSYEDLTLSDKDDIERFRMFIEGTYGVESVMGGFGANGMTSRIVTKRGMVIEVNFPWFTEEETEDIKRDHLEGDMEVR